MTATMQPDIDAFFDPATNTVTYLISDPESHSAAIIDSVLDYDAASGRTDTSSADAVIAAVRDKGLTVDWVLETHIHADHLTAAHYLKDVLGGKTGIGDKVGTVLQTFKGIYNLGDDVPLDGSQFDHLFADGEEFRIGGIEVSVMAVPGHTPACIAYHAKNPTGPDAVFVGDTIFMPDFGSARCDFPGGDARTLYHSCQRLFALPDETRMFLCHDYAPGGRDFIWETTVGQQRAENKHLQDGASEEDFVKMRTDRDKELNMPALILPAVQVNIRAGDMPDAEDNGTAYLKIPLNAV